MSLGDAALFTVTAGGTTRAAAVAPYDDSPFETLRDTIRLDWDAMSPGSKRTSRCSPTHATRTHASTSSRARATSASRSTAR